MVTHSVDLLLALPQALRWVCGSSLFRPVKPFDVALFGESFPVFEEAITLFFQPPDQVFGLLMVVVASELCMSHADGQQIVGHITPPHSFICMPEGIADEAVLIDSHLPADFLEVAVCGIVGQQGMLSLLWVFVRPPKHSTINFHSLKFKRLVFFVNKKAENLFTFILKQL